MLAWLQRLFTLPDDREIFAYWDGERSRRIDPLTAWRQLWSDPQHDFGTDFKRAMNPTKEDGTPFYSDAMVAEAEESLLLLVRKVFGVQAWTEKAAGLTVMETMDLLTQFLTFRNEIKKKRSTSPTPLPFSDSTEAPGSADSTPPEFPPTTEPDCGCTGSASSADELSGQSKLSAAP